MGWIKDVIDLLFVRKMEKKLDLEIQKLEMENTQEKRLVRIATDKEILRFDPKANILHNTNVSIEKHASRLLSHLIMPILLLVIIAAILLFLFRFM